MQGESRSISGVDVSGRAAMWLGVIVLAAVALRLIGANDWSLWQDEETSIYFSQRAEKAFPSAFPLFFWALQGVYSITGVSVLAGRVLAGAFGVATIVQTYWICRKYLTAEVGLIAAALLALSLGHVFWSQSIRYYTMLAAVEMAALGMLVDGFETRRLWKLVAAGVLINLAMLVHFTAVLLVPVAVGYLLLVWMTGKRGPGYDWKACLAVLAPTLLGMGILLPSFLKLQTTGATGPPPEVQPPGPLLLRVLAYYGVPMVALAAASPLFLKRFAARPLLLMASLGGITILEVLVIGALGLANITWYHGLVAMFGVAALAGVTVVGIAKSGRVRLARAVTVGSVLYYALFLGQYYTVMHGDRPPWREGCERFQQVARVDIAADRLPDIYATVPGVVAHYLGVSPERTQESRLVKSVPPRPPQTPAADDEWYLVKATHVTPEYERWFAAHCLRVAQIPARTGWIDRTVSVYYRGASAEDVERVKRRVEAASMMSRSAEEMLSVAMGVD